MMAPITSSAISNRSQGSAFISDSPDSIRRLAIYPKDSD
jgi:hypothetical protein